MTRTRFLSIAGGIGLAVGSFALLAPTQLLASKGLVVGPHEPIQIWVRETGLLIGMTGLLGWRVRKEPDSAMLRVVLEVNGALQLGLLPIELGYHLAGVLPSGIVPNTILHACLAFGFFYYAAKIPRRA